MVTFTDASLGNLNIGTGSTIAYFIWLMDRDRTAVLYHGKRITSKEL